MASIVLHNKLPQMVEVTVLDEAGCPTTLKLQPHQQSQPFDDTRLTLHARSMVASGHLIVRPVAG